MTIGMKYFSKCVSFYFYVKFSLTNDNSSNTWNFCCDSLLESFLSTLVCCSPLGIIDH